MEVSLLSGRTATLDVRDESVATLRDRACRGLINWCLGGRRGSIV